MSNASKILVIIGVIVVWFIISIFNSAAMKSQGHSTPGIIGVLLLLGMIAAVRAIWNHKTDTKKEDEDDDKHKLDKTNP